MAEPSGPPPPQRRDSSTQHTTFSIPPLRSFIPVTEEKASSLSPRGQRLSQLIQNRAVSDPQRKPSFRLTDTRGETDSTDLERAAGFNAEQTDRRKSLERIRVSGDGRGIETDFEIPAPPAGFPLRRTTRVAERRLSSSGSVLDTPMMRSQRLIGNSNPRYRWEQYWKSPEDLKMMKKSVRQYYERNNYLIQQYLYIDRLLDSSLPHNLIQEYNTIPIVNVPPTISEETSSSPSNSPNVNGAPLSAEQTTTAAKVKRTKDLYKVPQVISSQNQNSHPSTESTPLLASSSGSASPEPVNAIPTFEPEDEAASTDRVVTFAIYLNLLANTILLILKVIVTVLTSSLSVLASLVDAALDFLSTAIVWTTTHLINTPTPSTTHAYPVGRRRLEPLGVLVFSVIMITSFFQVALEALNRLTSGSRAVVRLSPPALAIMAATVAVKAACYLWCRLIRNSSVQALAQDAATDVVFNLFSIIFPLLGYYLDRWYLDPLGGLLLSLYVIVSWSLTTRTHILNLTGHAASADERNVLLYLTMRFARSVRRIQGCTAYHAGDRLNVEVDIVLDEGMSLRDSHDLGESLQYVLESVPGVERAFVHADYADWNIATHLEW